MLLLRLTFVYQSAPQPGGALLRLTFVYQSAPQPGGALPSKAGSLARHTGYTKTLKAGYLINYTCHRVVSETSLRVLQSHGP